MSLQSAIAALKERSRIYVGVSHMDSVDTAFLEQRLLKLRDAARMRPQLAVEDLCLLLLALRGHNDAGHQWALERLLLLQNGDGSWPHFSGGDREGAWVTALALTALLAHGSAPDRMQIAVDWLTRSRGREAGWFWQWKFRTIDTSVPFDPSAFGWSWVPGTTSWVIPTAFTLIALRQAETVHSGAHGALRERVGTGARMLFDRACPDGGWNAGNSVGFGVPYAAYPDATAIALLALKGYEQQPCVEASLSWLLRRISDCGSPYSLAWGILALTSYRQGHPDVQDRIRPASRRLIALLQRNVTGDESSTLAVSLMALEAIGNGRHVFEVPA